MKPFSLVFGVVLFLTPVFCRADMAQEITWSDLIPQQYRTEDPLAPLPQEDRDQVEWIIYLRQNLPEEITPREQELHAEMTEALPELKKRGIDVDQIIAERRVRDTSINMDLDGKRVRLAGYLLPLDLSGKDVREFLLVPYVGACIHVPPPPLNQIVHAVTDRPIKYKLEELFKPISATGIFNAKSLSKELFLGDGSGNVDIGYVMAVEAIEPYKDS